MKKTFNLIFLFFLLQILVLSFATAGTETLVEVVEGKVLCFDYPEEYAASVSKGRIEIGILQKCISEYAAIVEVKNKKIKAYIPYNIRSQIKQELTVGAEVLLVKNRRRNYKTEWDIISLGKSIKDGQEYLRGKVAKLSKEEAKKYELEAEEVKEDKQNEEQETEEEIKEDTNEEILEDEGIEIDDIFIDEEKKEKTTPIDEEQEQVQPEEEQQEIVTPQEEQNNIELPVPDENNDNNEPQEEDIFGDGEGPQLEEQELEEEEEQVTPPPTPEPPPDPPTPGGPTASISASPTSGPAPLNVNFDGSGSTDPEGNIVSYSWDFGDSNSATGVTVTNTYAADGTYTATLTVVDGDSISDSTSVTITVSSAITAYYVDSRDPADGGLGNDTNDGTSWATPWKTVSHAINELASSSGNIDVNLRGTFTNADEGFDLTIDGGPAYNFIGEGPASTIFDGENANLFFDIIDSPGTVVFSNIGFQNAYSSISGGALIVDNATVYFNNCTMSNNQSDDFGGFLSASNSSTIALVDCTLSNNSAASGGVLAIMDSSTLTDTFTFDSTTYANSATTFSSNTATESGGAFSINGSSQLDFSNGTFTFSQNSGGTNGNGAIQVDSSTISLSWATFSNNSATGVGTGVGGAIGLSSSSSGTIQKCTFNDNTAVGNGGAIFASDSSTVHMINCLFYSNSTSVLGGAVYLLNSCSPNIYQCTFSNDTSVGNENNEIVMATGCSPTIRNSIFNNDNAYVLVTVDGSCSPSVEYCELYSAASANLASNAGTVATDIVNDLLAWGWDSGDVGGNTTNLQSDPLLKASYNITNPGSPCVNVGLNLASEGVTDDIQGTPRPQGSDYDIGCFESIVGDPPITCRIYDSITGELVPSPTVAIYAKNSSTALEVSTQNPHTFNVLPGIYHLAVNKSGYGFPSESVGIVTPGDHGGLFVAGDDPLSIDIPIDPGGWLHIEKQVNKKRTMAGDIVTYHLKIQNKHWYQNVDNVELVDEIVNGFKYAAGSAYFGAAQCPLDSVQIANRKIIVDVGTIPARKTVNLSYQVRVGTGTANGKYKATAHARRSTDLERNSNYDSAEIEVQDDPLFTRGTIIGKVFYDLNANGLQDDRPEQGIPGVKIYTEYGVCIETDDDGKYHIADVPDGRHLLKVDPATLPTPNAEHQTNYVFTTDNPYFVKITEGLLAKVNFGLRPELADSAERSADSKSTDVGDESSGIKNLLSKFFIVGLGEGTVTNLNTSGNIKMADKDDRYDDGVRVDGRLAFYLKGKVLGKYLVTACVDTERLPGGRYRTKDLFTNLDPDKYYPVYGDASLVDYSGVDTQDVAYVLIEWNESYAKWGSFRTEFPFNLYERTLSGGIVDYVSVGKTKFGDPWTEVKGFGAVSRQKPAHDEFVGTGGSLYYLRHQDLIEGSEQLRIEVRDRISKATLNSIPLREEMDYKIDYDAGRIILKKPLNSVQQGYNSSIVSNDILMGERAYLIVDYEYLSTGLSDNAWGIRGSQQLGDHIRLGGTYVQEQKAGPNYELASGDATIKLNKDTVISGFYAHSKETQLGSSTSYDGGLTFNNQLDTFSNGKTGKGYSINGRTKLFENTDIYLSYSDYDPYFSSTNSISQQGTEKIVGTVYSRLTEFLSLGLSHITSKIKPEATPLAQLGARDTHVTSGIVDYRKGKWDLRAEYQHQTIKDPVTDYTYFGMLPLHNNDFIAARIGYQLFKWLHPYARGQATIRGEANNQGTVGADIHIWDKTWLNIAETVGNLGDSTLIGLTSQVRGDTDVYANIEVGNNLRLGKFARTTYGQSTSLSKGSRAYVEEDYSSYRENIVRGTLLGYEEKINETLALGLTYERSNVERDDRPEVINRDAGSIALTYLNPDEFWFNTRGIKGYTKLELRNDTGTTDVRQWVTENDVLWRLTEGLSVSGRGNWGWSENRSRDTDEAKFYELGTGFSYRPVFWDRLNLLGKYSYLTDLPPDSQWDFPEDIESKRNVYSLEGIFDLFKWVQLVGKVAYRDMKEKVGYRDWTESDTYLYLGRLNFHITEQWDIAAEYRTLRNKQIEDNKSGWLLEVDRELGRYVRLGVGYNFTDYDDDLRNADNYEAKGFFVRLNGKY